MAYNASAAILVTEDVENWNSNGWGTDNSGTYTLINETESALFDSVGLNATVVGSSRAVIYKDRAGGNLSIIDFYVYFNSLNPYPYGESFQLKLLEVQDSGINNQFVFGIMENGTSIYWIASGNSFTSTSYGTPLEDVTYHFHITLNRGVGVEHQVKLNSSIIMTLSVTDNTNFGEFYRFRLGLNTPNDGGVVNSAKYDNITIATSEDDFEPEPTPTPEPTATPTATPEGTLTTDEVFAVCFVFILIFMCVPIAIAMSRKK